MCFVQRALFSSPFRSTDMSYQFFLCNVALCGMFQDCNIHMVSTRNANGEPLSATPNKIRNLDGDRPANSGTRHPAVPQVRKGPGHPPHPNRTRSVPPLSLRH